MACLELALQSGLGSLQHAANDRLSLLQLTLDATIERFRYLPTALAQATPILDIYDQPDSLQARQAANQYLKSLNDAARSSDIYVLDHSGTERTAELAATNSLLSAQINERISTERDLRRTQDNLVQHRRAPGDARSQWGDLPDEPPELAVPAHLAPDGIPAAAAARYAPIPADIDDLNPLFLGERTDHGMKVVLIREPEEGTSHDYVVHPAIAEA